MKKQDLMDWLLLVFIVSMTLFIIYNLINYWIGHSMSIEGLILSFQAILLGLIIHGSAKLAKQGEKLNNLQKTVQAIGNDLKGHLVKEQ